MGDACNDVCVAAAMISPTPGTALACGSVSFSWDMGQHVTQYRIKVGTTLNGADIYKGSWGASWQQDVTGLPVDGSTVYVRLKSELDGPTWLVRNVDYQYTACDDDDGDGVAFSVDNCPYMFNPVQRANDCNAACDL